MAASGRVWTMRAAVLAAALSLPGCYTCYTGTATDASARQIAADRSWDIVPGVPFVGQKSDHDCGAAALAMVFSRWFGHESVDVVSALAPSSGAGIRVGALRDLARRRGLEAFVISGTLADLAQQIALGRPVVVGLAKPMSGGRAAAHYEVIVGLNRSRRLILSLDPARGLRQNTLEGFAREWIPTRRVTLIAFPRRGPPTPRG
jgi:ABC-type bacteriocin/lantibiotic exporter with double-glycine peptidase domain